MSPAEPRPGGGPPRPWADRFMLGLSRLVLNTLYREIELVRPERFPAAGPAIVIANHTNSLVDGGMLLAVLPRIPRFLAASTVWDYGPVAPFMNLAGAVKVFRRQDGRERDGSLADSFAEAAGLIASGGVLAVFPEGRTHDAPAMLPFKTGTARIAQIAAGLAGGEGLSIVPMGIDYEAKDVFRSRALCAFGAPVPVVPPDGVNRGGAEDQTARARVLTAAIERALKTVAPDFRNAEDARLMTLAGEIWAAPGRGDAWPEDAWPGDGGPDVHVAARQGDWDGRMPLSAMAAARTRVQAGLSANATPEAARVAARRALARYDRLLAAAGLTDAEMRAAAVPPARAVAVVLALPLALAGILLNGLPALAIAGVSRRHARDRRMTWVAFGALVLYPFTWIGWALGAGLATGAALGAGWGWGAGLATLALVPLIGRLSLPVIDRASWLWRVLRARRMMRRRPGLGARLGGLRAGARRALAEVVAGHGRV